MFGFLFALYLSCDWFFFLGFVNFRFAVALCIGPLALAQVQRQQPSRRHYLGYCALIVFGYLMHLAFVVFAAAAIATTGLVKLWHRRATLRREFSLLVPIAIAMVFYVVTPFDLWYWSGPASAVDWPQVACSYHFLLVMKPYEAARIGLRTEGIADNSSATLLAPAKDACRRS